MLIAFSPGTSLFLILLIVSCFEEGAAVKCHDCMDTEKGWCHDTTCEDEYCYKANATFNGKRILKLGCIHAGKIGCEKQQVHFPAIADVNGDFCICQTHFCNEALPAFALNLNLTLFDYVSSAAKNLSSTRLPLTFFVVIYTLWKYVL